MNGDQIALGADVEMKVVITPLQKSDATLFNPSLKAKQTDKGEATLFHTSPKAKDSGKGEATMFERAPIKSDRTIAFEKMPVAPVIPPKLVVNESGKEPKLYTLTMDRLRIGRNPDNDIVLENRFVSRHHAELERRGQDYYILPALNVSNPLLLEGRPVMEPTLLKHGDKIRIGIDAPQDVQVDRKEIHDRREAWLELSRQRSAVVEGLAS